MGSEENLCTMGIYIAVHDHLYVILYAYAIQSHYLNFQQVKGKTKQHVSQNSLPHALPPSPYPCLPSRPPLYYFTHLHHCPIRQPTSHGHTRSHRRHPQPHRLLLRLTDLGRGPNLRLLLHDQLLQRPSRPNLHPRTSLPIPHFRRRPRRGRSQRPTRPSKRMFTLPFSRSGEILLRDGH